jgi:outer membrane protein OmpA-like peptidoglycan-associated protein
MFAGRVTDVVVEFGNRRYQSLLDRYMSGEDVPVREIRQVWENTTQISGVWSSPIYEEFFEDVRAFNRTVPAAKRIRVLLGDPPIDWTKVTSPADEDMNDWRDAHFAWVVEKEVIQKQRKALLFVGGAHISRKVMLANSLIHILDRKFPGKTLVVSAVQVPMLKPAVRTLLRSWPVPSAAEVRGTAIGALDVRDIGFGLSSGRVQDDIDVVLFLGSQPFASIIPRIEPNSALAAELKRRQTLHEGTMPFRGGRIRFQHGSTVLLAGAEVAMNAIAAEMHRDRDLVLLVKAYSDMTEPNGNQLSQDRAVSIVEWLVERGIERRRLTPRGCGASRPAWDSASEEHRAANRRAEVVRHASWAGCQPPESFDHF